MFTSDHIDELMDAARKDGEHTAMQVAINVVDSYLACSASLDEFRDKWGPAKGVWQEMVGQDMSEHARRVGEQSADELRDALAVLQEHRA